MSEFIEGETVIKEIFRYAGINEDILWDKKKNDGLVTWRRIACYLLHDFSHWTQERIAQRLHYNGHETAKFHADKMRWWMANIQYAPKDLHIATRNIMNNLGL
jgi:chromosomal replication initiation ATPase DnaA